MVVEGLDDEVCGSILQSCHSQLYIGVGGEEHDGGLRPRFLDLPEPEESLVAVVDAAVEVHVEQHYIGLVLTQSGDEPGGTGQADDALKGLLGHHLHRGEDVTIVVDDE